MTDKQLIIKILVLIILLILSALFSSAETAITSLKIIRVKRMKQDGEPGAELLERLLENINKVLATALIGNSIANISATAIATDLSVRIFQGNLLAVTAIMTVLILLFGEITPKTFAAQNSEKVALMLGRYIEFFTIVLYPVLKILTIITNFFIKLAGGRVADGIPFVTEEEIRALVEVGQEEGLIQNEEKNMINSIFEFDDTVVREVMTPRIDMTGLNINASLKEALSMVVDAGYSRIPVYENTIDNIVGVLYAKDLLVFAGRLQDIDLKKIMRTAYYVPESKKVNHLLKELQREKVHMAIVLDEYGGTAGLVTIEDLLEEIVGDILDEYDEDEKIIQEIDNNTLIVNSRAGIDEINELLNLSYPEDEFETISGYVFNRLGRVPKEGDILEFDGSKITVLKVGNRRIQQVKIEKLKISVGE